MGPTVAAVEALSEVIVVGLDDGDATAAAALEAEERRQNAASVIEVLYGASIAPLWHLYSASMATIAGTDAR